MLLSRPLAVTLCLSTCLPLCAGFFDDILQQMMNGQMEGGGGGQQFEMNFGDMQGGGQGEIAEPEEEEPEFQLKCHENFHWMIGSEWNWNDWRNVKFEASGKFSAPEQECEANQCKWFTNEEHVYVVWGSAGSHTLSTSSMTPEKGNAMTGTRDRDGDPVRAMFVSVDESAIEETENYLYKLLGLDEEAEAKQIKKAYRKLSMKYHPDKNRDDPNADVMFKKVAKAYEILGNEELKMVYDMGGIEGVKEHAGQKNGQGGGGGMMDMFFGGGGGGNRGKKGPDAKVQLGVSLEDMYKGGEVTMNINRRVVCRGCVKKPDHPKCSDCGPCPNERRMVQRQVRPGMFVQQQQEVRSKELCKEADKALEVAIERGMAAGSTVTFAMASEQKPGQIPGDVIVELTQKDHSRFRREGNDLHYEMQITLKEALLGFSKIVPHLDGHEVVVASKGISKPNQVMRIAGEGMPLHNTPSDTGKLHVKLKMQMPSSLNEEQRKQLEELL